ncbi:U-box domain-containing protein 35-like [Impatiens glandulifera]|uniref:U-box domain-containing protein 35-like n=1 Tax=Impatiens glandulifera TaxID=253017 RepID=UPI001FB0FD04|nr:U-box domain-containing protein 35-like [Impatiens glandulifera]
MERNESLDSSAENDNLKAKRDVHVEKDDIPPETTTQHKRDFRVEMKKLMADLKKTKNKIDSACKEAASANREANELDMWQKEKVIRFEQARLSEEAALIVVQGEKARANTATKLAEKAQKLADFETKRRQYAELRVIREKKAKNKALDVLSNNDVRYRMYTLEDIDLATGGFVDSSRIGEGGYGPVYRGTIDHTAVAIKVLRPDAKQGRKQFQQEVEILSCVRHPNLVLLLGACPEYGCLVYEFMDYGSLEDRLLQRDNTPTIQWKTRFKIASEIATGLLFLHQAKPKPLVHRDLKPANILLDRNFVSKIGDVGLARLVPASVADEITQLHMTSAAGTFCYIDPEYQQSGKLGTKSDIYSLGVVLLQIITARPPMGLTHHVEKALQNGKMHELLDPSVLDWPIEEATNFARLSLKCSALKRKDRPDLAKVILPELTRLSQLER